MARPMALNEIEILANAVGGAPVPVKTYPLLRGDYLEKMAEFLIEYVPAVFQMVMERLGLVLGQHNDLVYLRIDTIAQGQIDKPINSAKGDCGLCAVLCQWHKPFPSTTCHNKSKNVFHGTILRVNTIFMYCRIV
jgi:hypothetical protein